MTEQIIILETSANLCRFGYRNHVLSLKLNDWDSKYINASILVDINERFSFFVVHNPNFICHFIYSDERYFLIDRSDIEIATTNILDSWKKAVDSYIVEQEKIKLYDSVEHALVKATNNIHNVIWNKKKFFLENIFSLKPTYIFEYNGEKMELIIKNESLETIDISIDDFGNNFNFIDESDYCKFKDSQTVSYIGRETLAKTFEDMLVFWKNSVDTNKAEIEARKNVKPIDPSIIVAAVNKINE